MCGEISGVSGSVAGCVVVVDDVVVIVVVGFDGVNVVSVDVVVFVAIGVSIHINSFSSSSVVR